MDRSRPARRRVGAVCPRPLSVLARGTFRSVAAAQAGYAGDKAGRRSIQPSRSLARVRRSFVSNDIAEGRSTLGE